MSPETVITRIAPTPSGYLHLGNALNFLLTWGYARSRGGQVHLRIDDCDSTRTRPEFISDIFNTLDWLGLDWDRGPSGPDDFYANFSQTAKKEHYFARTQENSRIYNCSCSRNLIRKTFGSNIYEGSCRNKTLPFIPKETAKRLVVDKRPGSDERNDDLKTLMGDFVVWTKDDTPAYQLVSLIEDEEAQITHIIRGEDLATSSLAQCYLAEELTCHNFLAARIYHHPLIFDAQGKKLAKSQNSGSLKDLRDAGTSAGEIRERLAPLLAAAEQEMIRAGW